MRRQDRVAEPRQQRRTPRQLCLRDRVSGELRGLVGLSTLQGQFTTRWDVVMAGSVLSIVPIALVYLAAQRYIIAGIANTGIK